MTPGPVQIPSEVLRAGSKQIISHRTMEFRELLKEILNNLKTVFRQEEGETLIIPGSGTTAVDAMIYSLIPPKSRVLTLSWGEFGERIIHTLKTRDLELSTIKYSWGEAPEPKELLDKLNGYEYMVIVHNETSTGLAYRDLKDLIKYAYENNIKVLVDTVSGLGGEEFSMEWGIYAAASCSHKALASPPGVGIVSLSKDAVVNLMKYDGIEVPPSINLKKYLKFLLERGETPFTPPVNTLYALRKSLERIVGVGLQRYIDLHRRKAKILYTLKNRYRPLPRKERYWSNTVVALKTPLNALEVKEKIYSKGFIIATGMGKFKNSVIRIGTMGDTKIEDYKRLTSILLEFIT